jgi:hypothetical protein
MEIGIAILVALVAIVVMATRKKKIGAFSKKGTQVHEKDNNRNSEQELRNQ